MVRFFAGRLIRIYPIYWIIITLTLLFPVCRENYNNLYIMKGYLLIPTYVLTCTIPSWTLCYELYFYFLAAFLILSRYFIYGFFVLGIISAITVFNLGIPFNIVIPEKALWALYLLEFFMGIIAYRLYLKISPLAGIIILTCGIIMHFGIPDTVLFYNFFKVSMPAFLIILGSVAVEAGMNFKIPALFLKIGDSSYILYMINVVSCYLVLDFLKKQNALNNYTICIFIIMITGLSIALHYFLEKPLLKFLKNHLIPDK